MSIGFEIEIYDFIVRIRILAIHPDPSLLPPTTHDKKWKKTSLFNRFAPIIGTQDVLISDSALNTRTEEETLRAVFNLVGAVPPSQLAYGLTVGKIVHYQGGNIQWLGDIKLEHVNASLGEIEKFAFEFASAPINIDDTIIGDRRPKINIICDGLSVFLSHLNNMVSFAPQQQGRWYKLTSSLLHQPNSPYAFAGTNTALTQNSDEFIMSLPLGNENFPGLLWWLKGNIEVTRPTMQRRSFGGRMSLSDHRHRFSDFMADSAGLQMTLAIADHTWFPVPKIGGKIVALFNKLTRSPDSLFTPISSEQRPTARLKIHEAVQEHLNILFLATVWNPEELQRSMPVSSNQWMAVISLVHFVSLTFAAGNLEDVSGRQTVKNYFIFLPKSSISYFIFKRFWSLVNKENIYGILDSHAHSFSKQICASVEFSSIWYRQGEAILDVMLDMQRRTNRHNLTNISELKNWWRTKTFAERLAQLFLGLMISAAHDATIINHYNSVPGGYVGWIEFCAACLPPVVLPEESTLGHGSIKMELRIWQASPLSLSALLQDLNFFSRTIESINQSS